MNKKEPKIVNHPAKYSDVLLPIFDEMLKGYKNVLDPFAGTGKLRSVRENATLLEIEPEWALINNALVGDALNMPLEWTEYFDAICTSPTYGNRLADHHNAKDGSKRYSYKHTLGRDLSPNNSGKLQWGEKYKNFHIMAWKECHRVLRKKGLLILNISNHIRKGEIQKVTEWHIETLNMAGFKLVEHRKVKTPRMRNCANSKLRVDHESILKFIKT